MVISSALQRAQKAANGLEPWQRERALKFIRDRPELAMRLQRFRHRHDGLFLGHADKIAMVSLVVAGGFAVLAALFYGARWQDAVVGAFAGALAGAVLTVGVELLRDVDDLPGDANELFGFLDGRSLGDRGRDVAKVLDVLQLKEPERLMSPQSPEERVRRAASDRLAAGHPYAV